MNPLVPLRAAPLSLCCSSPISPSELRGIDLVTLGATVRAMVLDELRRACGNAGTVSAPELEVLAQGRLFRRVLRVLGKAGEVRLLPNHRVRISSRSPTPPEGLA